MASTLFTYPGDFRAAKVIIAAQYSGYDLKVDTAVDVKKLKSKSSLGKAPVLETADGVITQSNAIARLVGGDKLFGKTAFEAAQVSQWVDYSLCEVELAASLLVYPILGRTKTTAEVVTKATADLKKAVMTLEMYLKKRTFFVGNQITFADVALACALLYPMKFVYTAKERKAFPCVERWFTTCVNQPEFKRVVGAVTLCAKKLSVPASSIVAAGEAATGGKKKKGGDKPAAAPKAAAAPAPAPAKKAKNPLDLLPATKFVLDTWKKTYSNPTGNDFYSSMPWFWENFDAAGWSIYLAKYKYNEENKVPFMVSNLVGGFIQRCDEIRKYAFGVMQIIGDKDSGIEVVGCWLFRGDSEKPILDCNPDAEYYEWIKVDPTDAAKQKEVADLWCADEKVYGKPIMDGKVFK